MLAPTCPPDVEVIPLRCASRATSAAGARPTPLRRRRIDVLHSHLFYAAFSPLPWVGPAGCRSSWRRPTFASAGAGPSQAPLRRGSAGGPMRRPVHRGLRGQRAISRRGEATARAQGCGGRQRLRHRALRSAPPRPGLRGVAGLRPGRSRWSSDAWSRRRDIASCSRRCPPCGAEFPTPGLSVWATGAERRRSRRRRRASASRPPCGSWASAQLPRWLAARRCRRAALVLRGTAAGGDRVARRRRPWSPPRWTARRRSSSTSRPA